MKINFKTGSTKNITNAKPRVIRVQKAMVRQTIKMANSSHVSGGASTQKPSKSE